MPCYSQRMVRMGEERTKEGLQMVWPRSLLDSPPEVHVPIGYTLRTYQPGDEAAFYKLMDLAGFKDWDDEVLRPWFTMILPDGWYFIVDRASGELVATAMAHHRPDASHPFAGSLGWLAGHPDHAGKGLGMAVSAAVVRRLLQAGYRNIYLFTEDWRLAALKIYLTLGWAPLLYMPDMEGRWRTVCEKIGWVFTPDEWPSQQYWVF